MARRGAGTRHAALGMVNVKVDPMPTWLWTRIRPPWSSMNFRHRVRPSPVPSFLDHKEEANHLPLLDQALKGVPHDTQ